MESGPSRRIDWKVLLIDDEKGLRTVTAIALQDAGYTVRTAADGAEGIRVCETFEPQIVITDYRMPVLDGMGVLETVKKRWPETEVILVTAFGDMEIAVRALQLDASDFITKPLSTDALTVALDRARQRYTDRKTLRDYTDHLERDWSETMDELMASVAFQHNLIENSMDGILGSDTRRGIVTFNRSMTTITGWPKEEMIGRRTLDDLFLPGELERLEEDLAAEGFGGRNRLFSFETHLRGKGDSRIPVSLSAAVILDGERQEGLVCFVRDLRELRRLEREMADQARILQQDKMISLGRLAASVAHEINNPLAGVLNYVRLMLRMLRKGGAANPARQEKFISYLELVEKETDRCAHIVSSLLTFSRKASPTIEAVSLNEVLERSILLSRHKMDLCKVQLRSEIPKTLPDIRGNFNQIQQCIINLIFNAIDAMPDGGTLTISADHDARAAETVTRISDTGVGIDENDLPHIFEPFFTTKDEGYGVGLGLSTVYGIIEQHGGTIDVASTKGRGTTFTLRLPASTPTSTPASTG